MNLLGCIFSRFGRFDLSTVRPEEIRADEIALEHQESKLDDEIDRCTQRIAQITQQVVDSGSKSKARVATRKIMQLKERIGDKEHAQATVSRSLIALGRLGRIIAGRERLAASGVLGRLQSLPQGDLNRLLCGEMARREIADNGLEDVLQVLGSHGAGLQEVPVDAEAERLMQAFDAAIEANDPTLVTSMVAEEIDTALEPVAIGVQV